MLQVNNVIIKDWQQDLEVSVGVTSTSNNIAHHDADADVDVDLVDEESTIDLTESPPVNLSRDLGLLKVSQL